MGLASNVVRSQPNILSQTKMFLDLVGMLCYGCGRNHRFPGSCVMLVRGIVLFGSYVFARFTRDRSPILVEVMIRIWSEVERFLFLCCWVAKCYEITMLTLVKYEYLPGLWPRNKKVCYDCDRSLYFTRNYVMEVVEATVFSMSNPN